MKRVHPAKIQQDKQRRKIFKRNEKIKRSALRQEVRFKNKQDDINISERLALINKWNQEEARKRLMRDIGMNPYSGDGLAEAFAIVAVSSAKKIQRLRDEARAVAIAEALSAGHTVTVTSNGGFHITETPKIPEGVVVIHSPRVSFGESPQDAKEEE